MDLIQKASAEEDRGHPLALISQLMRLYEHPALVPRYEPLPAADAIARSAKLATVLECLGSVRRKGEKALIFTRSTGMQELLNSVLRDRFALDADIINGVTPRGGSPNWGKRDRKSIIRAFQESAGFNVLILSPEVAGTGLTLVEANPCYPLRTVMEPGAGVAGDRSRLSDRPDEGSPRLLSDIARPREALRYVRPETSEVEDLARKLR